MRRSVYSTNPLLVSVEGKRRRKYLFAGSGRIKQLLIPQIIKSFFLSLLEGFRIVRYRLLGSRRKNILSGTAATSCEVAWSFLLVASSFRFRQLGQSVGFWAVVVENFLSVSGLGQSSSVQALLQAGSSKVKQVSFHSHSTVLGRFIGQLLLLLL